MELISIGRIAGTHHLKGAIKAKFDIEDPTILLNNRVVIETDKNNQQILSLKSITPLVGDRWVIEFDEIANKTQAETLKNGMIKVRRELLGLADDEYLLIDLVGMKVVDKSNDEIIGNVEEIFNTAAHDILVVDSDNYEAMIPNIDEFVKEIDFDNRVIYVELIEGMKEPKGKNYQQDDGMDEE